MFCRSLFVLLSFLLWSLFCLSFFYLWLLITPLASSNSSFHIQIQARLLSTCPIACKSTLIINIAKIPLNWLHQSFKENKVKIITEINCRQNRMSIAVKRLHGDKWRSLSYLTINIVPYCSQEETNDNHFPQPYTDLVVYCSQVVICRYMTKHFFFSLTKQNLFGYFRQEETSDKHFPQSYKDLIAYCSHVVTIRQVTKHFSQSYKDLIEHWSQVVTCKQWQAYFQSCKNLFMYFQSRGDKNDKHFPI